MTGAKTPAVSAGATLSMTTSNAGNKTFQGLVTVNGSWANGALETPFFEGANGGLIFNGDGVTNTFSPGAATYTFQGASNLEIGGSGAMTFTGLIQITTA